MTAVVFAEAVETLARVAVTLVNAHLSRRARVRLTKVELQEGKGQSEAQSAFIVAI